MIGSPASLRWAGLEGSPHLWKLGLREAGMLHGSVLACGISKAPLNPGPWALEPEVLGEGSAQSRKCWLGPKGEAGPLQPSWLLGQVNTSLPPGAYGFGLILHLAHLDSGAPPVSSTPQCTSPRQPLGACMV